MNPLYVGGATVLAGGAAYAALRGGPHKVRPAHVVRTQSPDCLVPYSEGCHFLTAPDAEATVRVAKSGVASQAPDTVMAVFARAAKKNGAKPALRVERGGKWVQWTWSEFYTDSLKAAKSFMALGLEAFGCVNVIGFNAPEWHLANMGAIAAGAKAAGIYTTNGPDACQYISEHSGARVVVVEDQSQLAKFEAVIERLPQLAAIVVYNDSVPERLAGGIAVRGGGSAASTTTTGGDAADGKAKATDARTVNVYTWAQFMALGEKIDDAALGRRIEAQRPGHPCTLIYTSGTTGNPKAVMISHDNCTWTAKAMFEVIPEGFGNDDEHMVSYLPLSHIAAQMVDIHVPMGLAASMNGNATVHFARPDALRGSLGETLKAVRPTFFFGVPRVWEKIAEKMKALGANTAGVKKSVVTWAKNCGTGAYEAEMYGGSFQYPFGFNLANALILGKIKAALGLDRVRMCATGAAPISHETLRYFGALGITIYELYGMSECTGPMTVCYPGALKLGSTGPALPGCELKIDHDAERGDKPGEGEICFRGRHIMMGYMKNETKSREAIDPKGWLHSGDVGRIDEDGFLFITGRIKELIITAGGENIAPVPVESAFKQHCPALSNAMMVGDRRKYNIVLVTLKTEPQADGTFTDKLAGEAKTVSAASSTVAQAIKDPVWQKYIQDGINKTNAGVVSRASKMQKFHILPTDFSVPGGELTATLKTRRAVVTKKYTKEIEALYA